jgi:hypothetical protein
MTKSAITKQPETSLAATEVNNMFGGDSRPQIPLDAPLPQVKILRETPQFELPDGNTIKAFTGHILHYHNANQLYLEPFGEGDSNGVPACASSDGIIPDGGNEPLVGPCRTCPKNEYGSAEEGTGKACQNTIRLYILIDGEILPCVLKAPPSSLGKKDSLIRWLTNAPNIAAKNGVGVKYQPIKVRFSLHTKEFKSGMSASVIDLETVKVLQSDNKDDLAHLRYLSDLYNDFMTSYTKRIRDDVSSEAQGQPGEDDTPI